MTISTYHNNINTINKITLRVNINTCKYNIQYQQTIEVTKDVLRLARLQVIALPLLVDIKFHFNPNIRHSSFKSDNKDISPILKILTIAFSTD